MSQNQVRWRGLAIFLCDIADHCIALSQFHRVVLSQGCLVAISQFHRVVLSQGCLAAISQYRKIADRLIVIIIMCNSCSFCNVQYAISHIGDFKVFQCECSLMHAMRWSFASQSHVFYHFGSFRRYPIILCTMRSLLRCEFTFFTMKLRFF